MLSREMMYEPKGGILADDMGLGKTMQTIATMRGNPQTTLIISIVATVAQWRDALFQFGDFKPILVNPSFKGILPDLTETSVVLTTYSCFQAQRPPPCFSHIHWGRIILDEGHTIKNASSKTYKEISKLQSEIKWILSGTPVQNNMKELLTLTRWIGYQEDDMEEITQTLILRRTQEEQGTSNPRLALPPLDTKVIYLEFASESEREFYNKVDETYAELTSMNNSNTATMEAILRCRQAATHPQLFIDSLTSKKRKLTPEFIMPTTTTKFTYILNDILNIQQTTKEKTLIFCTWTQEMKMLQKALAQYNISSMIYDGSLSRDAKESTLYNFIHTTIPILILQISCGNAGLNLQCASRVYITSPHWNPCVDLQALGRAYRKGQTNKVTVIRTLMRDTIEDKCGDVQMLKLDVIREAMGGDESMKDRLGGIQEEV